ncbi:MAG: hypothetical protein U5K70_04020 [Halodesulfurarchaeum sp.]|nr:hypothetical protein [Halodesulfurarchaeum sp.]
MDCTVTTTAIDGASLVSAVVENPHDEPARFRVENDCDGPVWPPRRRGYVEPGWDESGYEGVLEPGECVSLGYAVPAEPAEPPARLAWTEPATSIDRGGDAGTSAVVDEHAADSTARSFTDPRPPRGVLSPGSSPSEHRPTGEWP